MSNRERRKAIKNLELDPIIIEEEEEPILEDFGAPTTPFTDPFSQMQGYDLGQTTVDPLTGLTITE